MYRILLGILLGTILLSAHAKVVGVYGHTFPIAEEDFLTFIHDRLAKMKADGQLDALNKAFVKRVKKHVLRPAPVGGLSTTNVTKTYFYDPTFILQKTIRDDKSRVIYPIGTRINPLDHVGLHITLFFINADDARQIQWAKDEAKKRTQYDRVEIVLVKGNIVDAQKALDHRIFFDQSGYLTTKLGITHVPTIVQQGIEHNTSTHKDKKMLEITSFSCIKGEASCSEE